MIPDDPGADGQPLYFNGISALTGEYLVAPMPLSQCTGLIRQTDSPDAIATTGSVLALPPGCNPLDIGQTGWAIVFGADEDTGIRKALTPLITHRRQQVGNESLVKVLEYRAGETRARWLGRYEVAAGAPDPYKVPYYLLLVGSPQHIPFVFGSLLDVEYAVGRIAFSTAEEYERYALSVVEYETRAAPVNNAREVLFFATEHPYDGATLLSSRSLVQPLADCVPELTSSLRATSGDNFFKSRRVCGADATKVALGQLLRSADRMQSPIFFIATHGMGGLPPGDPRQAELQGALLCQDWPGLGHITPSSYFTATDLPLDAHLDGVIAFVFACYSAGTPQYDRFFQKKSQTATELAKEPFFAQLPQRLLAHPHGGALACVGHLDRAWGYSIAPAEAGVQLGPFRNFLNGLFLGYPVGHAIQDFNHRYAILSADLASALEMIDFNVEIPDKDLARMWIQRNDAEGYAVFGDPAVRLRVADFA